LSTRPLAPADGTGGVGQEREGKRELGGELLAEVERSRHQGEQLCLILVVAWKLHCQPLQKVMASGGVGVREEKHERPARLELPGSDCAAGGGREFESGRDAINLGVRHPLL